MPRAELKSIRFKRSIQPTSPNTILTVPNPPQGKPTLRLTIIAINTYVICPKPKAHTKTHLGHVFTLRKWAKSPQMTQACTSHCVPPRCPKVAQLPYKPEKDCHLRHLKAMAEGVIFKWISYHTAIYIFYRI